LSFVSELTVPPWYLLKKLIISMIEEIWHERR